MWIMWIMWNFPVLRLHFSLSEKLLIYPDLMGLAEFRYPYWPAEVPVTVSYLKKVTAMLRRYKKTLRQQVYWISMQMMQRRAFIFLPKQYLSNCYTYFKFFRYSDFRMQLWKRSRSSRSTKLSAVVSVAPIELDNQNDAQYLSTVSMQSCIFVFVMCTIVSTDAVQLSTFCSSQDSPALSRVMHITGDQQTELQDLPFSCNVHSLYGKTLNVSVKLAPPFAFIDANKVSEIVPAKLSSKQVDKHNCTNFTKANCRRRSKRGEDCGQPSRISH